MSVADCDFGLESRERTLFLDRDGVVNVRIMDGYVRSWQEFVFETNALDAIRLFSDVFDRIVVVTNQQGVGKGLMTQSDLDAIHHHMRREIEKHGGRIDGIYACTELDTKPDNCRKPSINMALRAKKDYPGIEFERSVMIGDSWSDIEFAYNANMKAIYITKKEPAKMVLSGSEKHIFENTIVVCKPNLWEAAQYLIPRLGRA